MPLRRRRCLRALAARVANDVSPTRSVYSEMISFMKWHVQVRTVILDVIHPFLPRTSRRAVPTCNHEAIYVGICQTSYESHGQNSQFPCLYNFDNILCWLSVCLNSLYGLSWLYHRSSSKLPSQKLCFCFCSSFRLQVSELYSNTMIDCTAVVEFLMSCTVLSIYYVGFSRCQLLTLFFGLYVGPTTDISK